MNDPQKLGSGFQAILDTIVSVPTRSAKEVPIVRRWAESDLWHGIPEEFRDAEVSPPLMAILKGSPRPKSFALVGPPGTGKTRSLWAMLHAMRKHRMVQWMGMEIERRQLSDGEYATKRETYAQAIERVTDAQTPMAIITEVGHLRAKRYDRAFLDACTSSDDWLAIDDIGAIEPNEWIREALYHLANERRANNRTTIWTSNLTPQKIRDTFGAAIASRILGGAVIEVDGKDRRLG